MQRNPLNELYRIVILAVTVILVGVFGYRWTAGLSWLDALYMTIITLATVGYREVGTGLDDNGKLFTIGLILGGAGVMAYAIKASAELLLDETTRFYLSQRKVRRKLALMKEHFIVCGLGRVGRSVCEELENEGFPFVLVESEPELVTQAAARGWSVLLGDATDEPTLATAGIERARGLMSCIKSDADNLMVVVTARGLTSPDFKISARVSEERNLDKFRRAGADHIYSPFSLVGRRLARSLTRPRVMELLDLALEKTHYDLTIAEYALPPDSPMVGQTLQDSAFRSRYGLIILSIIRLDRSIVHNPPADTLFSAGDILVLLGTPAQVQALRGHLA